MRGRAGSRAHPLDPPSHPRAPVPPLSPATPGTCHDDQVRKTSAAVGSIVFFMLAPGVVAGVIPWWLTGWEVLDVWPVAVRVVGTALIASGAVVLAQAFVRFVREGLGTPAPVAPTETLVVGGLYRHVRNPMYLAVLATILGQALLLGQPVLSLTRSSCGWRSRRSCTSTRNRISPSGSGRATERIAPPCRDGFRGCDRGLTRTCSPNEAREDPGSEGCERGESTSHALSATDPKDAATRHGSRARLSRSVRPGRR